MRLSEQHWRKENTFIAGGCNRQDKNDTAESIYTDRMTRHERHGESCAQTRPIVAARHYFKPGCQIRESRKLKDALSRSSFPHPDEKPLAESPAPKSLVLLVCGIESYIEQNLNMGSEQEKRSMPIENACMVAC